MSTYPFSSRHIGPRKNDIDQMLQTIGLSSLDELIDQSIPKSIRLTKGLDLEQEKSEIEAISELKKISKKNKINRSLIGMGYYGTITPTVIQRNILENPGWYTQYTPYQAEISQGRLEALLNYQTMVAELTGLPISNASLLDESTAAAEAMNLCFSVKGSPEKAVFAVSKKVHPQTQEVIKTRAEPLGIQVLDFDENSLPTVENLIGVIIQYPDTWGGISDYQLLCEKWKAQGALVVVATDLMALTLLKPPGEWGADIVVGSAQRFGVPMGYGGPHPGFFSTKDEFKRFIPGRLVGVSVDSTGSPALRLALQTREQHIRREKATSNICTAQALPAIMASMYAVYHGPYGLRSIARRINRLARVVQKGIRELGLNPISENIFDTLSYELRPQEAEKIFNVALARGYNLRLSKINDQKSIVGLSIDETFDSTEIKNILDIFASIGSDKVPDPNQLIHTVSEETGFNGLNRKTSYLRQEVFNKYHSEHEMLRYIHRLESKDLSLTSSMIPLGSCTMKLNATSEMIPVSWEEFSNIHPFSPLSQAAGYLELFSQLEKWLAEITGFDAVSLQPNAGSQGEYAGLLVIRRYHQKKGEKNRNICLIPRSAHGTNPASATMAGMKVVVVECDKEGNIDLTDLRKKAIENKDNLAALMITYPSTHGVFEESVQEICKVVHDCGGQVYLDGANMNAQVGLCRPGDYGADVCHLNLHKTFCIPHGGGGPGMGPICVKKHLEPFLPGHPVVDNGYKNGPVSAAPWGSPSILVISWMYIRMMGPSGLKHASEVAILNANYIAKRLEPHYPILYRSKKGWVAHECIIDLRKFKETAGVEVEDVAKRLMDYGFHAPTISWPVAGTMMIEPTESESKEELDRFCDAMIFIRDEIRMIEEGKIDKSNNMLKNAPHTALQICSDEWNRPYSRQVAAFPAKWLKNYKFWPSVSRINNAHGDRNLVCTCPDISNY